MVTLNEEEIKKLVRQRYASVARGASSCCAPSSGGKTLPLYTPEEVAGLPEEALGASAGCGNPTALASLQPGETVVDFGSGGGIDCFLAARAVGPTGKVIGVDMTPDMVSLARGNARKLGLSNVQFYLAEMEHTPIRDESADVIISNCVINLAPDKDAVFREAFRILRPGGRVFISDMVLVKELPAEVAADARHWTACLAGAELKDMYLQRMRNAGFVDVEVLSEAALADDGWMASVRSMNIRAVKPANVAST